MPNRSAVWLLSSLLLLGLISCSARVSQCGQLINTISQGQSFGTEYEESINTALAQFSSAQNLPEIKAAASDYTAAMQKASSQSSDLAQDLSALEFEDDQLTEYQQRYTAITTQWSAALTTTRDAMQVLATVESEEAFRSEFGRFQAQTESAYSAIQAISAEESQLVEGINAYCESAAQ